MKKFLGAMVVAALFSGVMMAGAADEATAKHHKKSDAAVGKTAETDITVTGAISETEKTIAGTPRKLYDLTDAAGKIYALTGGVGKDTIKTLVGKQATVTGKSTGERHGKTYIKVETVKAVETAPATPAAPAK